MAMGWLPDKKTLSYHVFLLLILLEYRKRFPDQTLRLEKVMMDFELAGHSFFSEIFNFESLTYRTSSLERHLQGPGLSLSLWTDLLSTCSDFRLDPTVHHWAFLCATCSVLCCSAISSQSRQRRGLDIAPKLGLWSQHGGQGHGKGKGVEYLHPPVHQGLLA